MRCFLAADITDSVKTHIRETTTKLANQWAALPIRWVDSGNVHITLHFLGADVAREVVKHFMARGAGLTLDLVPLELTLGRLATLPHGQPLARVIYFEVLGEGSRQLDAARNRFTKLLSELNIPVDVRPWHPHLTIGRLRQPASLQLSQTVALPPIRFPVAGLTLYQSTRAHAGPVYQRLIFFPFHGVPNQSQPGRKTFNGTGNSDQRPVPAGN